MKITKKYLQKLIKEETQKALNEKRLGPAEKVVQAHIDRLENMIKSLRQLQKGMPGHDAPGGAYRAIEGVIDQLGRAHDVLGDEVCRSCTSGGGTL